MTIRRNLIGQIYEPYRVRFLERDVRPLRPDEILVKIRASAICGSDLHIARGLHPSVSLPATIGHEFSGDVVEIGAAVTKINIDMRVTVEPCIVCGACDACRHGEYGYCEHINFIYRNGDGAMADYVIVKEDYVYELPSYLDYETGALIEPLAVATHAVRRANIRLGETVLIIGAGAIGMMVAAMCRKSGAAQIIISDLSDHRLALAKKIGADITINSAREDLTDAISRLTKGKGVDKSFECVGLETCFLQSIMTLKRNGLATIVGIYEHPEVTFPASRLVTHEIKIQGAQGYCWDFPIALAAAKDIPLKTFITHRFPMNELQKALDTALDRSSGSIKIILTH